jgi:hypothetical protein
VVHERYAHLSRPVNIHGYTTWFHDGRRTKISTRVADRSAIAAHINAREERQQSFQSLPLNDRQGSSLLIPLAGAPYLPSI